MHRWKVGSAEIVRVEDSSFALATDAAVADWMVPHFAPSATEIGVAFSAFAVAVDGACVVVDPWLADDSPRERSDAKAHVDRLIGELAAAGFAAGDVDLVVNTHLDGIGWNTRPDGRGGWCPTRRRLFDELAERRGLLLTSMLGGSGGGRLSRSGATYRLDP
jgi:hypothetical protein